MSAGEEEGRPETGPILDSALASSPLEVARGGGTGDRPGVERNLAPGLPCPQREGTEGHPGGRLKGRPPVSPPLRHWGPESPLVIPGPANLRGPWRREAGASLLHCTRPPPDGTER